MWEGLINNQAINTRGYGYDIITIKYSGDLNFIQKFSWMVIEYMISEYFVVSQKLLAEMNKSA